MSHTLAELSPEYFRLFAIAQVNPRRQQEVGSIVSRIVLHRDQYAAVEEQCGTPWYVIALLHNLECDLSFFQHLHNGDLLSLPTVNDPKNRPPQWMEIPPVMRTWQRSAVDSLHYDGLDTAAGWDVAKICYEVETFNGWGYRAKGVADPYLWSGCQHYTKGKYISDHHYDPEKISEQIGAAVVLRQLVISNVVALKAVGVSR